MGGPNGTNFAYGITFSGAKCNGTKCGAKEIFDAIEGFADMA
jgi:hypothetical protein